MSKKEQQAGEAMRGVLVFEMETVALGARRIRYEVLSRILGEQGLTLSEAEFSRFCLGCPKAYMPTLLERKGYTAAGPEQVTERLRGETLSRLMQKDCQMDAGLKAWLDAASARGTAIVAASCLAADEAEAVAERLGFGQWHVAVCSGVGLEKGWDTPEGWQHAAQLTGRHAANALAVTTGAAFARAALAAGCHVTAVPDEFTDFEDFGGVDFLASSLSELKANDCFEQTGV